MAALGPSLTHADALTVRLANPSASAVPLPEGFLPGSVAVNAVEDEVARLDAVPAYGYATFLVPVR